MNISHKIYTVFTPSTPAKENYVERTNLTSRISSALNTVGKQIIIYGHSGVGKTTLLHKEIEKCYSNHISTLCTTALTYKEILIDAFNQLEVFYEDLRKEAIRYESESQIANNYFATKESLLLHSSNTSTQTFDMQLTASKLADFLGEAETCWILEDFHKVNFVDKKMLSQTMKVFMDKSAKYEKVKVIALGAVNSGREVIEYDAEMKKRISEIEVTLMSKDELNKIISNGAKLLNISFNTHVKDEIVKFSNGLASVCHAICLYMCEDKNISCTMPTDIEKIIFQKSDLEKAIQRYIEDESDSMKDRFNCALIQNKEKNKYSEIILKALLEFPSEGATNAEIMSIIKDDNPSFLQRVLTSNLEKLQTEAKGALIRFDNSSAKYSFREPFYKPYALAYFREENTPTSKSMKSLKTVIGKIAYEALVEEQMKKYRYESKLNITMERKKQKEKKKIFISYSKEDEAYLKRLNVHLKPLIKKELIEVWTDKDIRPGDKWKSEIQKALEEATIAILLISADFLASDFILDEELPVLLKKAEENGTKILPIILSHCSIERNENINCFQAFNSPKEPLSGMEKSNVESILDKVAEKIEDIIKEGF